MKASVLFLALLGLALAQQPKDEYKQVTYRVLDEGGVLCATFKLAAQFQVTYFTNDPDQGALTVELNLPPIPNDGSSNTTGDLGGSDCPDPNTGASTLRVQFENQMFTMQVGDTNDSSTPGVSNAPEGWEVKVISLLYSLDDEYYFPNSNSTGTFEVFINNTETINIRGGGQDLFQCNAGGETELAPPPNDGSTTTVAFKYKDMLLNPYNATEGNTVSCSADNNKSESSSKTVPIAVGAALGGLLVLVVIAYIVGRKMRSKSGYQKV